ncbi:hypothetical protein DVK02_08045 [Halobellus sp. Atlit-31R]|nr:hypothetical protein DVK02_08045 [Halobellus sp. Atlit-31R]
MARDRSLDEFVGGDAAASAGDSDGGDEAASAGDSEDDEYGDSDHSGAESEAAAEDRGDSDEVARTDAGGDTGGDAEPTDTESATVTYRWSPDGVECPRCGRDAERLWLDGGQHVCDDCKEW